MSYTLIVASTAKRNALGAIDGADVDDTDDARSPETAEQLEAAKRAVELLLPVVGGPKAAVTIEISGHANADHQVGDDDGDEAIHLVIRTARR